MKSFKITIVAAAMLMFGFNSAKAQAFEEGKHNISVGYGYALINGSLLFSTYESYDNFNFSSLGPINLQYEFAVGPKFGIGIDAGYSGSSASWKVDDQFVQATGETINATYDYKKTKLTINLRGNVHFGDHDMIDPYLGFGLGFKTSKWALETNHEDFEGIEISNLIPVSLLIRFGTRIMFTDNIGAFIEGGFGHGLFQGGLVAKL